MIVFAITRWPGLMPPNFSAAYAIAFCAGVYFPGKLRWILPLGTLLAMDIVLNLYYGAPLADLAMWGYILVKLGAFAALVWLGTVFTARSSFLSLLSGGLLGAILFYLITNFASWLREPGYAKTLEGLFQALTTGLPGLPPTWTFFKNTLLSGGLFTGLFCAVMKASEAAEEAEEPEDSEEPEGQENPA